MSDEEMKLLTEAERIIRSAAATYRKHGFDGCAICRGQLEHAEKFLRTMHDRRSAPRAPEETTR